MRLLIDTNIVIDYIQKRAEYYNEAKEIVKHCAENEIEGYVAPIT